MREQTLGEAIGLEIERRERDADDFLPICVPENAAEIRRIYKEQRELVAAQQARIEELEAERRWIPVSERMPPYGEIVLTSTGGKYPAIDYLKPNNLFTADHVCEPQFNVKYWMPCPEPPELEGE